MKTFELEIITPEKAIFKGTVSSIVVPATDGKIGILANHAKLIASLDPGPVKVEVFPPIGQKLNPDRRFNSLLPPKKFPAKYLLFWE